MYVVSIAKGCDEPAFFGPFQDVATAWAWAEKQEFWNDPDYSVWANKVHTP